MKKKGTILILIGIIGALFEGTFDIIAGKPVNDISGPKSIAGFLVCAILIVLGAKMLVKK